MGENISIGYGAFQFTNTDVYYLGDIVSWCNNDFSSDYTNPLCGGGKLYLNGELARNIVIPATVKEIKTYAFEWCSSIESVIIEEGVKKIHPYAFTFLSSLETVKISKSVTEVGENAFFGCYGTTIYCEAEKRPSEWSYDWNYSWYGDDPYSSSKEGENFYLDVKWGSEI